MIGGASLATLAAWALGVEGARCRTPRTAAADAARAARRDRAVDRLRDVAAGGGFLIGLSTLQIEFDFGVPQFRQLYHPILLVLAASIALVAVRIRAGRGAALGAVAMFWLVNGTLSWAITEPLGRSTMHVPLYLVEALVVEAVASAVPRRRQLTLGLAAGAGIATVGLAAEWAWSHAWMPLPWGTALLPEAPVLVVRMHTGTSLQALPLHLPDDAAIPAPAVELDSGDTGSFLPDKQVLQREARTTNVWLERGAYALLLAVALTWVATLAWGLRRLDRAAALPPTEDGRYAPNASPFVIDR